jgi:hypothetical protein
MIVITVYFQVALFPEKIYIHKRNQYENTDENNDDEIERVNFDKYVCKESQSKKICSYLKQKCNFDNKTDMYLRNLKYNSNGDRDFSVELILFDDDDIEDGYEDQDKDLVISLAYDNLCLGDLRDDCFITIKDKLYMIDIKIIDVIF